MRFLAIGCSTLALSLLATPALAQRKKPTRKNPPAAAAAPKAAATPPAAEADTEAEPEAEPPPPPPPKKKKPKAHAAPPPEPEPVLTPDEGPARPEEAAGTAAKKSEHQVRLLDASLALSFFQRHLSYGGDTANVFPPYDMNGGPAAALEVGVFPYRTPQWSVGLTGGFQYAFALNTDFKVPMSNQTGKYSTKASQYDIGAKGRYHFGPTGYVGVGAEYGAQNYSIDLPPPTPTDASVPDVSYSYLRPNVEARFDVIPKLAILADAGYLLVFNAGEITSDTYFIKSRSSVFAFDVGLGVAYEVVPHVEIHAGVDYRRYHFKFSPLITDPRIATSADDSFLGFALGVGYWM
jgi:opacity protein-like surface antigen